MTGFALNEFLNGHRSAFDVHARNTVTGETRTVTVYTSSAMGAYGAVFVMLDTERNDRSWCIDGYTRRDA